MNEWNECYIYVCFSVPYTSCHNSQPKGQNKLGKLGFWEGEKGDDDGGGSPFFWYIHAYIHTNKQTKFYQLLTYLLQSTYSRVLNFIITLNSKLLKFLTYAFFSFCLWLYITFKKHFFSIKGGSLFCFLKLRSPPQTCWPHYRCCHLRTLHVSLESPQWIWVHQGGGLLVFRPMHGLEDMKFWKNLEIQQNEHFQISKIWECTLGTTYWKIVDG
jgi:hypothetical protein